MDAKTTIYQILTMYTALYTIRDAVTLAASEELANSYVEGLSAIDVCDVQLECSLTAQDSAFVRQYREMRTRHHVRSMLHEQCVNHRVQWHT